MSDTSIIDAHAHLGLNPRFYFPESGWRDVLAHMDRCRVDAIVQTHQSMLSGDWASGADENLEAYEGSNGRILAYAPYNPNHPDAVGRVERLLELCHYVGIKIHPSFHGLYADDDAYEPAWCVAQERGVPILTHSYDRSAATPSQKLSWVPLFVKWLEAFPDVDLILGHSGGLPTGHRESVQLARSFTNVWLDTAGDPVAYGFLEYVVGEVGSGRLLYGSDLTWIDSRAHLARIFGSRIGVTDKQNILGGNARQLFRLDDVSSCDEGGVKR